MSTINCVFSLSLFLVPGYFTPRMGYRRVPKFCMGFWVTKKIIFGLKQKLGAPPVPRFRVFFSEKTKCLESPERKLIGKSFNFFDPLSQTWGPKKIALVSMGGWAEGLVFANLGAKTPIGASRNWYLLPFIIFTLDIVWLKSVYKEMREIWFGF